jgi:hypothetical protein
MANKKVSEDSNSELDIITLPLKIESRNVLDRQHWAKKKRSKQEFALFIRNQMRLRRIPPCDCATYKVSILSLRKKQLDYDNLVGGCKQLIDALIDEKFIYDDSPDYLEIKFSQTIVKTDYQTIITRCRLKGT